ncbi:MAG TPA: carboxypeptidase regulatory-like domain-containing protein [Alphaproteobacteria bacterium]|nr:carboxypeptidase regulatory-like domain-containing protein [Alphaproteobacteria bacterium]
MRKYPVFVVAGMLATLAAWPQQVGYPQVGSVVDNDGKPVTNVEIVYTNQDTNRSLKSKTDKNGAFYFAGIPLGDYKMQVIAKGGEVLTEKCASVGGRTSTGSNTVSFVVGAASNCTDSASSKRGSANAKVTKEQIKAESDKVASLNTLVAQAQTAMQAQNWPQVEEALKQLIAAQPDTTHWEFYKALADSQKNQNKLEDALQTYGKGTQVAESIVAGTAPKDSRNPNPDPVKAKAGAGAMLTSEGNIYVKLKKPDDAIAAFTKSAEIDPNPSVAYYNICALQYNAGKFADAVVSCQKSITANAGNADAWFIRGAALYKTGKPGTGKYDAPEGTAEALNKYLSLDPNGDHVVEAKNWLKSLGQK